MTREPVACDENDTVQQVAALMRTKNVGFVVVLGRGKVTGVVTDRQLAVGVLADDRSASSTRVNTVMTRDPARVTLDDTIFSVIDTFRSGGVVRRLPVVNDLNELVGVVSISDVAVIAKDLIDAILLEDTRHALKEVHLPSGGKHVEKEIRSPTSSTMPRGEPVRPVTTSSVVAASRAT
ncbi:MAG: CBS domain-containing protein [Candidatus Thermoplasmatota archaeon]